MPKGMGVQVPPRAPVFAVAAASVDPIVGVAIAILFIVKDAATAVWLQLIDGIEPEILAEIEHAPNACNRCRGGG